MPWASLCSASTAPAAATANGKHQTIRVQHGNSGKRAVNTDLPSAAIPVGHRRWSLPLTTMEERTHPGDVRRGSSTRFIGAPNQSSRNKEQQDFVPCTYMRELPEKPTHVRCNPCRPPQVVAASCCMDERTTWGDVRRPKGSRTKANTTRNNKISSLVLICAACWKAIIQARSQKGCREG